jgi:uncharacterized membrane protein
MAAGRNQVKGAVRIRRTVEQVFAFYRDFANLPRFLGDVMAVELLGPTTSRWTIQGPFGVRTQWVATVTAERVDELIAYETDAPAPTRASWEVRFAATDEPGWTDVREVMTIPLGRVGRGALRMIGKPPAAEIEANLNRLKQLLETGRVTDTRHSVRGKFDSGR